MDSTFEIGKPIVFFDGECAFCNGSVHFILKWEKGQDLQFSSLNSSFSQRILEQSILPDSLVYFENGRIYTESMAAFQIAKHLRRPFSWFSKLSFLPIKFTNSIYRIIARYRYVLFGKTEYCSVISHKNRSRFIQ